MAGPQALISRAGQDGASIEPGTELDRALLLVRVSTMKMLRLQLAIERRDRAVALQAVDDLMELDRWIEGSAGHDVDTDILDAIAREVDDERHALLHERFGLAAGLVKRPPQQWVEPDPLPVANAQASAADSYDFLGPVEVVLEEEQRRTRWWLVAGLVMLVLVSAGAGAAYLLGWQADAILALLFGQGGW